MAREICNRGGGDSFAKLNEQTFVRKVRELLSLATPLIFVCLFVKKDLLELF